MKDFYDLQLELFRQQNSECFEDSRVITVHIPSHLTELFALGECVLYFSLRLERREQLTCHVKIAKSFVSEINDFPIIYVLVIAGPDSFNKNTFFYQVA
ncbi:hypothetical protein [Mucilaginibacter pocheonensis]|uniref:Uncharacterized protein n=1 Tax=Mucilaginibacter pocheonensis TaxID=398050 RepID=A0ABU1TEF9_9SPHI|nr:hypothetical protein [Mucilaginibacter pocheonensis]MDR6943782.1 hypothetical protein [Mucilaginibacter pocheonensis]